MSRTTIEAQIFQTAHRLGILQEQFDNEWRKHSREADDQALAQARTARDAASAELDGLRAVAELEDKKTDLLRQWQAVDGELNELNEQIPSTNREIIRLTALQQNLRNRAQSAMSRSTAISEALRRIGINVGRGRSGVDIDGKPLLMTATEGL